MAFTKIHAAGINTTGDFTFGNVTVTSIQHSDGSAVGGAGLGTAIDGNDQIYYTDTVLSIGSTTTINPPDSSNIAYTQYAEIAVEEGFDLIVEDGDDLVPDILGLSTGTAAPLAGAGGRVRADNFTNKAGTGAPTFPSGVNVTGVVTATSFSGDGSALTGIDATSLKDSGGSVKIQANTSGAVVTGVLTATSFSGDVNAGVITATSSINVGNSFINSTSIGIGTTDTTGRDAGIGTATGTLIFNTSTGQLEVFHGSGWAVGAITPFVATSPTVTADTSSRPGYAVFSFTSPGSLVVASGNATAEYLVIAGGAAGGGAMGGGGGAGGYRTGTNLALSPGTYQIQVGGGGESPAGLSPASQPGGNGTPSFITNPGISSITASGGGGGGSYPGGTGIPGGSGGGGSGHGVTSEIGGTGNIGGYTPPEGNNGGTGIGQPGVDWTAAGGGGGAGGAGNNGTPYPGPPRAAGPGGNGASSSITGSPVTRAGGGGGGARINGSPAIVAGSGGPGGGGTGGGEQYSGGWITITTSTAGSPNTGGGGGGGAGALTQTAKAGGSGIVIIAYPTS
jgi:hypothetical protein